MSADGLKVELRDGILILTLSHPPMNALTVDVRSALLEAIAKPDETCRGIVICADGPNFSGHQPLDPDQQSPSLAELCRAVEQCSVPVIAVLKGLVTGPGAELALAARSRLADPSARIAFSDIGLGLCPFGGSTRRLPRLIGAEAALRLMLTGVVIPPSEALSLGLIDGITEVAPVAAASRLAGALAAADLLRRPDVDPAAWTSAVAEARKGPAARREAGGRIIDCVEAALVLPVENAQAFETVARSDLEQSESSVGLRAAARAERVALALPPVLGRLQALSVNEIGLVGLAPDLARIAVVALSREIAVNWSVPDDHGRDLAIQAVESGIEQGLRTGRLTMERAESMLDQLSVTAGVPVAGSSPFVVSESPLPDATDPATSGAARLVLNGPEGTLGLSLSVAGRVCEVALPPDSLPLSRATALAGLRRMGLSPVLVGHRPVIGARMADAGRTALAWMVAHGVPQRMIAAALDDFGIGVPDPVSIEVPRFLRAMRPGEILNRWLSALANEGARLIDEGIARRPSDIDYLMIAGYHFPRWRGGPMHLADRRGLMVLRHDLRTWSAEAALWRPAQLVDRLISDGSTLAALNG